MALQWCRHQWQAKSKKGHGIHSPFVFKFVQDVLNSKEQTANKAEQLRRVLLKSDFSITYNDYGAGSGKVKQGKARLRDMVKSFSVSPSEGVFLQHLVDFVMPNEVIELGTSLGFSTMYLASANAKPVIHSVEGNNDSARLAIRHFQQTRHHNIKVYVSSFDDFLNSQACQALQPGMVYIDGNHTYSATLKYFNYFKKQIASGGSLVINDIYWSPEMYKAWCDITTSKDAIITIDLFNFGVVFFREGAIKQHFKIKM